MHLCSERAFHLNRRRCRYRDMTNIPQHAMVETVLCRLIFSTRKRRKKTSTRDSSSSSLYMIVKYKNRALNNIHGYIILPESFIYGYDITYLGTRSWASIFFCITRCCTNVAMLLLVAIHELITTLIVLVVRFMVDFTSSYNHPLADKRRVRSKR